VSSSYCEDYDSNKRRLFRCISSQGHFFISVWIILSGCSTQIFVKEKPIQLKSISIANGETIGYRELSGGDKIILLIHGNMTSSKHWDIFMDKFPKGYKIYAIQPSPTRCLSQS
jgi:hypothetical protein